MTQIFRVGNDWDEFIAKEIQQPYFQNIIKHLEADIQAKIRIFPRASHIFNAMKLTPISEVKVVILGQDPYHGVDQANGLSFAVNRGIPLPPSLRNIFIELNSDIPGVRLEHGDLTAWGQQGVLLLNSSLTVRAHEANSHSKIGWQTFTDNIIRHISDNNEHVIFVLWGNFAQKKIALIDEHKHTIIQSVHPSPLSVHRGFFGSKPFSKINQDLIAHGKQPIDWNITM